MNAFHAYDIRGIYNTDFNKSDAYKIGFFLQALLKAKKVLVGRDARISSPEIFSYLSSGLTDAGAEVYDAGLCTTPMVYWATARFNFDASVMITASHNSKEYNGMKVSKKGALPVGYDNGLKIIESKILNNTPIQPKQKKGKVIEYSFKEEYLDFQKKFLSDYTGLSIAIDCSNGMAGLLIRTLFGDDHLYINEEVDGNFPNHEPNPLNPKNIKQLQNAVLSKKCDIGIIFDGDADRVMFVDEQGQFIPPDLIIAVLGHYFLKGKKKPKIVLQDIRSSKSVAEYLKRFDAPVDTWKVGRAFAAIKLREINGIFGGELAGHYYFRDFYYSDSGIMACLLVLGVVSDFHKKGLVFSSLIKKIRIYENSGELNYEVGNKDFVMEKIKNFYLKSENPIAFYNFDGYRIEFSNWWFNIRPSNTEPYLRLLVEANTSRMLVDKVNEIETLIKKFK